MKSRRLDIIDLKIIGQMQENCRYSYRSIARKFNLSANTIKNRIDKMIQKGIVNKFVINIEPNIFNYSIIYVLIQENEVFRIEEDKKKFKKIYSIGEISHQYILIGQMSVFRFLIKKDKMKEKVEMLSKLKSIKILGSRRFENTGTLFSSTQPYSAIDHSFNIIDTDFAIMYRLLNNPRMKVNDLASSIKVTSKTIKRRIDRLIRGGILNPSIIYNPTLMQGYIPFHVIIRCSDLENVIDNLNKKFKHYMFSPPLMRANNDVILDMHSPSIYKLNRIFLDINKSIKSGDVNLLIPVKIIINQDWILKELRNILSTKTRHLLNPNSEVY